MYNLHLTDDDIRTIDFVGYRYAWSSWLQDNCQTGDNELPEHVAWELQEAFESDTNGGHSMFPMLDHSCNLAEKLFRLLDAII